MYEIERLPAGVVAGIKRLADGVFIPLDEGNADYRAFLAWNEQQPEGERHSLADQEPALDYLKQQKRQALDAWLAAEEAEGYTPDGKAFALRMSSADQTEFTKLDATVQKLTAAGRWSDADDVPLGASDGHTYLVTVAEWQTISVGYAAACVALWRSYAAYRNAIEAATTAAELEAIAFG